MSKKLRFSQTSVQAIILAYMYDNYPKNTWELYKGLGFVKFNALITAYRELRGLGLFGVCGGGPLKGNTCLSELGTIVMFRTYNCLEDQQ